MGAPPPESKEDMDKPFLTDPPFYLKEFEQSYRYIIDEYEVQPKDIAIFMPCAVRKPYSTSPSHQLIRMIISQVLDESRYHIVIFGTCGIVPSELETMYPYAHYKYMLGKCNDDKVKEDFLKIETDRVAGYLEKTRHVYKYRIAYCIGLFREALIRGSEKVRGKNRSPPSHKRPDQPGNRGRGVPVPGREPLDGRVPGRVLRRPHPVPERTPGP